jgi:hypothetical protein
MVMPKTTPTQVIAGFPNAKNAYTGGVTLFIANKVYPFPKILVSEGHSVVFRASPNNAQPVLLSTRKGAMTINDAWILRAGESIEYEIRDTSIFYAMGFNAGDVILFTAETD